MGGSGGGGNYRLNPSEIAKLREEARSRLDRSRVDSDVNAYLQDRLVDINDRDHELVSERLDDIESSLAGSTSEVDRVLFGGSVAKHTFVDGLSDIDAMVVLDPQTVGDQTPGEMRSEFRDLLRKRLDLSEVEGIRVGTLAVTIKYRDGMEVQILPAVEKDRSIAISSSDGQEWATINPKEFTARLSRLNEQKGQSVVPAIKLAKAVVAQEFSEATRPSGYHVEALALAAFRDYEGPRTAKAMVQHFFEAASEAVSRPITDVTGQSQYVDQSLGEAGSADRRALSRRLLQIARKMQQADSVAEWRHLVEDE